MNLHALLPIIVVGAILNVLTTLALMKVAEGEEKNPILKRLIMKFGEKALLIWLPVEVALILVFAVLSRGTIMQNLIVLAPWIAATMNGIQLVMILFSRK